MKCYQLKDWELAQTKVGFCVEGLCQGTSSSVKWHSSEIVKRISSRVLESSTGSQYKLVGPMSKANCSVKYLPISTLNKFKNGFPVNWKTLLKRKTDYKGKKAKKKLKSTNEDRKGVENLVDNAPQNVIQELIPSKMVPNVVAMPQALWTCNDANNCYEIDCLTAFDSDNSELNEFVSPDQTLNSPDDSDIFQCEQNVRKRLNFANIDDTQASHLFAKTASKRFPRSDSFRKISSDVLVQSFPDRRTTSCRPQNHSLENLNASEDCLLTDTIHFEPMVSSKSTFSGEQLLERKQSTGAFGNIEAVENLFAAPLVNSNPRANKQDKITKSSRPQTIPKLELPHKSNVRSKLKRSLPHKKKVSPPKRIRLESCEDAIFSDEDLNQDQVRIQAKVMNLSDEAPMSCNPNDDISFDVLTQSFGPSNVVFKCSGSPNKILENVFLNVSQDCLLSDSICDEHDDKSRSTKLSEMAVQTGSSICASLKSQKNDQRTKQSNKKVRTKIHVSRRSPKRKSAHQKVNLEKPSKIKMKESKVGKENNLPEILKGKNTLKKSRAFKKLMTDCLKTQGNRLSYFADISQQQQIADKEAAKVLALFDGDDETSEIHFDLTSSVFSKSLAAGVSKTLVDSTSSVMNDTAAVLPMPSLQAVRDADLEIFRINKIMKSKKTTEPKAQQPHNVKVQKGSFSKKCLELPEEAFLMNEVREEESVRDDYFNESEI